MVRCTQHSAAIFYFVLAVVIYGPFSAIECVHAGMHFMPASNYTEPKHHGKVKPTGFYFQFQARCEAEFWGKCLQAYLEFISFDAIDHMEAIGKPECRTAVYKVI